jgi:hypothetical protein
MLTQRDLDGEGCGIADCGHDHSILWLYAECHPRAGLTVAYVKATGGLLVSCKQCTKVVAQIEVAALPGGSA